MNEKQEKLVELLKQRTPNSELRQWAKGYIPSHYKRLSVSQEEAYRLAKFGFKKVFSNFGSPAEPVMLYFTQSLIVGAALSGDYDTIKVITPSQYGKSYIMGFTAILKAALDNEPMYVVGADKTTTDIIMNKIIQHLQISNSYIRQKLLDTSDKIEKLQSSLSKRKIAMKGGGLIEAHTLGETYADAKKGNAMIGRGGNTITDEASMVADDTSAELGRREFATDDGSKYLDIEISNPHNPGAFFNSMIADTVDDRTLIVWMDALTALEEGRIKTEEQILGSKFFKNKSTCTRYLLCELEDYSEESMFPEPKVVNNVLSDDSLKFVGIDSAGKGKDNIEATVVEYKRNTGKLIVHKTKIIEKGEQWVDGKTGQMIIDGADNVLKAYNASYTCCDIGYGIYLVEGLVKLGNAGTVKGIDFGERPTPIRKKAGQFSAVKAANKRAEMHLDLMDLMDNGKIEFTEEVADLLKDQLRAVKYTKKPNGSYQIIAKKEIKKILGRSPDTLDSVLLAVHAAILFLLTDDIIIYE